MFQCTNQFNNFASQLLVDLLLTALLPQAALQFNNRFGYVHFHLLHPAKNKKIYSYKENPVRGIAGQHFLDWPVVTDIVDKIIGMIKRRASNFLRVSLCQPLSNSRAWVSRSYGSERFPTIYACATYNKSQLFTYG